MSKELISMLVRRYGPPKVPDPEFMISELERVTSKFGDEIARPAYEIIVTKNPRGFFPPEQAVIEGCNSAKSLEGRPPATSVEAYKKSLERNEKQRELTKANAKGWAAHWLATNELGRMALLEGWARSLQKLLVQKYDLNARYGKPDLNEIHFLPDDIAYFRKHSKPLNPRLDYHVIFGEQEGEAWFQKYMEANGESSQ